MVKKIDLFELWLLALDTFNTHQGGHLRPRTFQGWVNAISRELFNEYVEQWEKSQVIDDRLGLSFLTSVNASVARESGKMAGNIPYPENYGGYSSSRLYLSKGVAKGLEDLPILDCKSRKVIEYKDADDKAFEALAAGDEFTEVPVTKVDNQRWSSALNHALKAPSLKAPIITQDKQGFRIAPAGVGVIILDYFTQPKDCKFAYVIDPVTDAVIYDELNSEQLEWVDLTTGEFINRLKLRYASLTDQQGKYQEAMAEGK